MSKQTQHKTISGKSKERAGLFATSATIQKEFKSGVTGLLDSTKKIINHAKALGKDGQFTMGLVVIGDRPQDLKKTYSQNAGADLDAINHFVGYALALRKSKADLIMSDYPTVKTPAEKVKQLDRAKATAKQWWSDTICGNKKKQVSRQGASSAPQSKATPAEKVKPETDLNAVADIQAQNYVNALTAMLPNLSPELAVSWEKMIADVKGLHAMG